MNPSEVYGGDSPRKEISVFYINLDSRTDRKTVIEKQLSRFNSLYPIRISAINAESAKIWAELKGTLALDVRSLNNLSTRTKTSHMDIDGWGAVGCFQSHVKTWRKILEMGLEKAWILEDDAILKDIQDIHVSPEAPLVWLGLRGNVTTTVSAQHDSPYPKLLYDRTQYGCHAYCVHSSLLPLLIKYAENPLSLSVDFFINEVCLHHKIYVGFVPLFTTNEFLSHSDIDHFSLIGEKSILSKIPWKGLVYVVYILVFLVLALIAFFLLF